MDARENLGDSSVKTPPNKVQPNYGIRWLPTILGAFLVIAGFVLLAAGLAAPLKSSIELLLGFVFLVFGIGLIWLGRQGITRSLRSTDKAKPMKDRTIGFIMALLLGPGVLSAQHLQPRIPQWSPTIIAQTRSPSLREGASADYRTEGMIVGAAILGGIGYWIGHAACEGQPTPLGTNGRDCTSDGLVVGLVGGALGAGLGFLVGRSIRK